MTRITFGKHVGGRSAEFDAYLRALPAAERAKIEADERRYLDAREHATAERDHAEGLRGLEDRPAGPRMSRGNRPGFDY